MTYICDKCHCVVEENELWVYMDNDERNDTYEEHPYGGYEHFNDQCDCGGQYVEAVICEECGDYFAPDEMDETGLVCQNCANLLDEFEEWEELDEN